MGKGSVRYLKIPKMANKPKAKPSFNLTPFNKIQTKNIRILNKK